MDPKIVLLIFVSGKIVLTGAKSRVDIDTAFEKIYPVLEDAKKRRLEPTYWIINKNLINYLATLLNLNPLKAIQWSSTYPLYRTLKAYLEIDHIITDEFSVKLNFSKCLVLAPHFQCLKNFRILSFSFILRLSFFLYLMYMLVSQIIHLKVVTKWHLLFLFYIFLS